MLTANTSADDYALANQGQLKNIATAAAAEMDAKLNGGAGDGVHALLQDWSAPNQQRNDFAPINNGQLKMVAKPFYDRLIAAGLAREYPWSNSSTAPDDYALVNVGQVKNLFAFPVPMQNLDSDGNGLLDSWETLYFGQIGVDPAADADGDGLTNLQEYQQGSDPTDYYNGHTPFVSVLSGDRQRGVPGKFLQGPVIVAVVSDTGEMLINAPVRINVLTGDAKVCASGTDSSAAASTVVIRTDGTGVASIAVLLGRTPNEIKTFDVRGGSSTSVGFSCSSYPAAAPFVACGNSSSFAFDGHGALWVWGANLHGQLGDGTLRQESLPKENTLIDNVRDLKSGIGHTVAVKWDGTVWTSGWNVNGQLGDGTNADKTVPAMVPGLRDIVAIAAGGYHTLALASDGSVWAWGYNGDGELGDGTGVDKLQPVRVMTEAGAPLGGIVAIAAGAYHNLAIDSAGKLWAWGANWSGQLGDGTYETHLAAVAITLPRQSAAAPQAARLTRAASVAVSSNSVVTALSAGAGHSTALLNDGTVLAWGSNWGGQLGNGTFDDSAAPIAVSGLTNVTTIASGDNHNLAIRADGSVWVWGDNSQQQLGVAGTFASDVAIQVPNLTGINSVAGGAAHSLASATNGYVWSFGSNFSGQLGRNNSASAPDVTDVDADHNGFSDIWEIRTYGATGHNPYADDDHDGLTNLQEYQLDLNPNNPDSDGDGVPDGQDGWPLDPTYSPPRLPDVHYALIDLGPGSADAVNNVGDVIVNGKSQSFVWSHGRKTILSGGYFVSDINDSGQMVAPGGQSYYYPGPTSPPELLLMKPPPEWYDPDRSAHYFVPYANHINNGGTMIATRSDSDYNGNPTISLVGTNHEFASVYGVGLYGINDSGVMVGYDDSGYAVRVQGVSVTENLGALPAP